MPYRQTTITSRTNKWIRQLRLAATRGTTVSGGWTLAESPHLLQEALRSSAQVQRVFAAESALQRAEATIPPHRGIPVHPVADGLFQDVATTARSQGVLSLVRLPSWTPGEVLQGLTIVLDAVQDPGNAGTIARSAEAFGASGIVFLSGSAAPTNPKCLRAAAGSMFRLPHLSRIGTDQLLGLVASHGCRLLALAAGDGTSLAGIDFSGPTAVVVGSETHGVRPPLLDAAERVVIPTHSVESLNAGIAAAVVLYESARRSAVP
ncbi:MAG: RNA methyltransferase [Bryobacterales bacterium]|nr:RNA methyltransferase [Bryobacterales bacterium]